MKKIIVMMAGVSIAGFVSICHSEEPRSAREQEVEFNVDVASFYLTQMLKQEKEIAGLSRKDIAVFFASARINRILMEKKDYAELDSQKFSFVVSAVLYRLAILAQTANMPPAVVACHFAEARNLENVSKGKPPVMPNCRADAYGPDIQAEVLRDVLKPAWAPNDELVTKWAVNAFSYAEAIGNISMYGTAPAPKIEPKKPQNSKSNVSMADMYKKADDRGKVSICAPILWKYGRMKGRDMQIAISEKARQYSSGEFEILRKIGVNSELLTASAMNFSKPSFDKAWKDSADDPVLLSDKGFADFAKMCFEYTESLSKRGWFLPSEKISAESIAARYVQDVRYGKSKE